MGNALATLLPAEEQILTAPHGRCGWLPTGPPVRSPSSRLRPSWMPCMARKVDQHQIFHGRTGDKGMCIRERTKVKVCDWASGRPLDKELAAKQPNMKNTLIGSALLILHCLFMQQIQAQMNQALACRSCRLQDARVRYLGRLVDQLPSIGIRMYNSGFPTTTRERPLIMGSSPGRDGWDKMDVRIP